MMVGPAVAMMVWSIAPRRRPVISPAIISMNERREVADGPSDAACAAALSGLGRVLDSKSGTLTTDLSWPPAPFVYYITILLPIYFGMARKVAKPGDLARLAQLHELRRVSQGRHDDRCPERDYLGHRLRYLGRIEHHADDGVRAELCGVVGEPVEGLLARLLRERGVLVDLPAL